MKFNELGLVTDEQHNQTLFIPWRHVHGLFKWVVVDHKPYDMYPGHPFTREQVAFIRTNYTDAIRSWGYGYTHDSEGHAGEQRDPVQ